MPVAGTERLARGFVGLALTLAVVAVALGLTRAFAGAWTDVTVLSAVALFAAWMATAVVQLARRLRDLDDLAQTTRDQARISADLIAEVRRRAESLRNDSDASSRHGRQTLH